MPSLRSAIQTLHRDRDWWWKVLIGGVLWLTVVGYPCVEGHSIESAENTQNGFPTPLPRWNDLGTKYVQGVFAMLIDFALFGLPLLLGGMFFLCSGVALSISDGGQQVTTILVRIVAGVVGGWLLVAWLSSVSPIAKGLYINSGDLAQALSSKPWRTAYDPLTRGVYAAARLRSLPVYGVALLVLAASWWSSTRAGWFALALLVVALAALVYARLVSVQLYAAAGRAAQQRRFESLRAQSRSETKRP